MPSATPVRVQRPVEFLYPVRFATLNERKISSAANGTTTPNALNIERIKFSNTSPTTVTDFLYGQEGQELVLLGDGYTSVANNTKVKTSTASTKLLTANKTYKFTRFNAVWVEQDAGLATPTLLDRYTIYAAQVTHNTTGTSTWFPNNVNAYPIAGNFLGVATYRIVICAAGSGGTYTIVPTLYWSTDGTTWTADSALASASYTSATPTIHVSASQALPSGAAISTGYLALRINPSGNVIVYSIAIELST